jgi:hypothetical protein
MTRRLAIGILAMLLAAPLTLMAHGPEKHKGKATTGTVTSISGKNLSLKTKAGFKTVSVTDKTRILDGETSIEFSNLKAGDALTVHGTTLASGEIVAEEIMKGPASSDGTKMGDMKGHGHEKMGHKP